MDTPPPNNPSSQPAEHRAWLVEYAPEQFITVAINACHEIIPFPQAVSIPGSTAHSYGVWKWHEAWLPLISLGHLVSASTEPLGKKTNCLVVGYRSSANQVRYGGIAVEKLPTIIPVHDACACALPNDGFDWGKIAISCFFHNDKCVPIVDGQRLFNYQA